MGTPHTRAPNRPAPAPAPAPMPMQHPFAAAPIRRRRWPLWVGGAALFLLGLSAGVMIERWRAPASEQASNAVETSGSPEMVPDPMPSNPLVPPSSPPTSPVAPPVAPPSSGGGIAADVTAFIERFGKAFCDKAIECGMFEESNRGLCESAVAQSRDPNAGAKIAAGDCSFDRTAADRCLRSINGATCDPSADVNQMATLLATSMLECERAYSCR